MVSAAIELIAVLSAIGFAAWVEFQTRSASPQEAIKMLERRTPGSNRRRASLAAPAARKPIWVLGCYGAAIATPRFLVLIALPARERGFLAELGSGLGMVAFGVLGLQLVLPSRVRLIARPLGSEVAVRLHRP